MKLCISSINSQILVQLVFDEKLISWSRNKFKIVELNLPERDFDQQIIEKLHDQEDMIIKIVTLVCTS